MNLLRHPATWVWLVLATVTALSWWFGSDHGVHTTTPQTGIGVGLLIAACIKARLIIFHFMEVRHAPWPLRLICDLWVVVVGVSLISMYWSGSPH
ncbi:cytochrome C oxidase subunit IV family protein [Hydrocarboniphaga sp.]|uniref:cytochrome C oxidase subunit IV family protein n=1 Tax=Hydrocarboniphaga sp. TaxID=2033016 RepID=UPI003D0D3152